MGLAKLVLVYQTLHSQGCCQTAHALPVSTATRHLRTTVSSALLQAVRLVQIPQLATRASIQKFHALAPFVLARVVTTMTA
jgi:hypothetical protein